jgi:hypothetical protein
MIVKITSVSMRYKDGAVDTVQVHFSGQDEGRTINVNGYVPLTSEQYAGNESVEALDGIVRQQVSTKILEQPSAE